MTNLKMKYDRQLVKSQSIQNVRVLYYDRLSQALLFHVTGMIEREQDGVTGVVKSAVDGGSMI